MIKKTTNIVFQDNIGEKTEEMLGGIPLTKGELVHVHNKLDDSHSDYEVIDKIIDCELNGKEQKVNIKYVLKKK